MTPRAGERGSATVELVVLTPALILVLLFVVAAGRLGQARNDVYGAAADAARAASIRQHPDAAADDARATARRSLGRRGLTCRSLRVASDVSSLRPGGSVTIEVACAVDLRDLGLLALPGRRTVTGRATEVVDRFRSR